MEKLFKILFFYNIYSYVITGKYKIVELKLILKQFLIDVQKNE